MHRAHHCAILVATGLVALFATPIVFVAQPTAPDAASAGPEVPTLPTYDTQDRLLLPAGFEEWVFVGSSLGLGYSEGGGGTEMFHHTLMEPTAYRHFRTTGNFREGTMLALLLHGTGEGVLPARRGRFASTVHAVELAVKDSERVAESWAYYNFGVPSGLRDAAAPMPAAACQACHQEHAAYDHVFLQFYPLLANAAPPGVLPASLPTALPRAVAGGHGETAEEPEPALALAGLDPVHLVAGREELGKPEIVMEHDGYRYQFLSEPSRRTFEEQPQRYAIQNDTCPVIPGAAIDPSLVAVHDGRIFAFASPDCAARFNAEPDRFLGVE